MHNRIKSIILATMADWEMQVKGKINMDSDFFATLLAIEIYKELQAKEAPAPRPNRKKESKSEENQTSLLNLGVEVAK